MFQGRLKSRFYSKCKADLKLTRIRIEMIKKKKNAMQKYLRSNVVDLLRNGLDYNAYRRADELIVEMNTSSCYDLIDHYCDVVLTHLASLDKPRECPEKYREAVSTLMFAAAWLADLPELRQLRALFSDRFGKSLDFYVDEKFVEKVKSNVRLKDVKLRLLREIVMDTDIEWDSKALENKLYNESIANANVQSSLLKHCNDSNGMEHKYEHCLGMEVPIFENIQVQTTGLTGWVLCTNGIKEEEYVDETTEHNLIPPSYKKFEAKDKIPCPGGLPALVKTRGYNPRSNHANNCNFDGGHKEKNKENMAQGQRVMQFFDKWDTDSNDDNVLDKLLDYYSQRSLDSYINKKNRSDDLEETSFLATKPIVTPKNPNKQTQPISYQLGISKGDKPHVHPMLPDYDEFMARLTTLRKDMH